MIAYRIGSRRHPIFDGAGAAEYGARWNSPRRSVIYAASSLSLAMLEQLAHAEIGRLPKDHAFIEITIPDSVSIETLTLSDVAGWNTDDLATSRAYGDRWLAEQRTCVLLVPSVIVPTEYNVLINPPHADCARVVASLPRNVNWNKRLKAFMKRSQIVELAQPPHDLVPTGERRRRQTAASHQFGDHASRVNLGSVRTETAKPPTSATAHQP